ncbi:MAG: hypothetical protein NVS9B15_12800 [Acidobacteriaceae bacterium]
MKLLAIFVLIQLCAMGETAVVVSPTPDWVISGGHRSFTATVRGGATNLVTWSSSCGELDAPGNNQNMRGWTAPLTPPGGSGATATGVLTNDRVTRVEFKGGSGYTNALTIIQIPPVKDFRVSTAVRQSNVVTVTTSVPHTLIVGDSVTMRNFKDASFFGQVTVGSVLDATHFTYSQAGADNTQSGGEVVYASARTGGLPNGARGTSTIVSGGAPRELVGLNNNSGYTGSRPPKVWIFPACTVTATSVDDGKTATAAIAIVPTTIRIHNFPTAVVAYKDQPISVQNFLYGTIDRSVTWSVTPASGTTLRTTASNAIFKAAAPGSYTITARSVADKTKSDSTVVTVTDHAYPGVGTPQNTEPVDCTAVGSGHTYEIHSDAEWDSVTWPKLGPGDTVRIHAQAARAAYHRLGHIQTSGTPAQPIRVCGVPDAAGNLPLISGVNAVIKANTGDWGILQGFGLFLIYNHAAPIDVADYPKNIVIEGIDFEDSRAAMSYTNQAGATAHYVKGATSIRIQHGENVLFRGIKVANVENGNFSAASTAKGENSMVRYLGVTGSYFTGNSTPAGFQHNFYMQAFGQVLEGNYVDPIVVGGGGSQFKMRGPMEIARYNYIEGQAGRIFDLVEQQDADCFAITAIFTGQQLSTNGCVPDWTTYKSMTLGEVAAIEEVYQDQAIYGNIIHHVSGGANKPSATILHNAPDTLFDSLYGGTVYFFYNTIFESIDSRTMYYTRMWQSSSAFQTPIDQHKVFGQYPARMTNNIWYSTSSSIPSVNDVNPSIVLLDRNWFSARWGTGNSAGGAGTGIANATVPNVVKAEFVPANLMSKTQVYGAKNIVGDASLPFDARTYIPTNSTLLNPAELPRYAAAYTPLMEYDPADHIWKERKTLKNMGAREARAR